MTDTMTKTTLEMKNIELSKSPVDDLAQIILRDAIEMARKKINPIYWGREITSLIRDRIFFDYLRHGIARGVAEGLAANDKAVIGVFSYETSDNPYNESGDEYSPDLTVHLLVLVKKPTEGLKALIASLDRAITAQMVALSSPKYAQIESTLDISLITQDEVKRRSGLAALLSSVHAPPMKVWPIAG